ncbi:MAG: hypothetical protein ACE5KZ_07235 [Candidatus Scalinduaceae bacterium]
MEKTVISIPSGRRYVYVLLGNSDIPDEWLAFSTIEKTFKSKNIS